MPETGVFKVWSRQLLSGPAQASGQNLGLSQISRASVVRPRPREVLLGVPRPSGFNSLYLLTAPNSIFQIQRSSQDSPGLLAPGCLVSSSDSTSKTGLWALLLLHQLLLPQSGVSDTDSSLLRGSSLEGEVTLTLSRTPLI